MDLAQLTNEEKFAMLHGDTLFTSPGVERLGIAPLVMSDGPHGVRPEQNVYDFSAPLPDRDDDFATYLPTEMTLAATWNPDRAHAFGSVLGAEARARGKNIILGPGVNIIRTPLNGRNFEYLSEDPVLSAILGGEYIRGVQSRGIAACVKHFAANNQETKRGQTDARIDEETLREIYLPAFRHCVTVAGALTVMSAYNSLNGATCSANRRLLTEILRDEWGFQGIVISDWAAVIAAADDSAAAHRAGLDLEMGQPQKDYNVWREQILADADALDEHIARHLHVRRHLQPGVGDAKLNAPEHRQLAREIAEEGIVLLKNSGNLLPLDASRVKTLAVVGPNADTKHARLGGSSEVKTPEEITPLEGLRRLLGDQVTILSGGDDPAQLAARADAVIYIGGLDHAQDHEGEDRADMKLPGNQDAEIRAVAAANPATAVVLTGSGMVEMDAWLAQIPALLFMGYAGMEGGAALARLLFGHANPSGKLPFTIPKKLADSPAHALGVFPGENQVAEYKEGLQVGYRWFDVHNIEPQYPFGHGLSYTAFALDKLRVEPADNGGVRVTVSIRNTGPRAGAEVVQVYLSVPHRPSALRALKAFAKVTLAAGEERAVTLTLSAGDFATYQTSLGQWSVVSGEYTVHAGTSSRHLPLRGIVHL